MGVRNSSCWKGGRVSSWSSIPIGISGGLSLTRVVGREELWAEGYRFSRGIWDVTFCGVFWGDGWLLPDYGIQMTYVCI